MLKLNRTIRSVLRVLVDVTFTWRAATVGFLAKLTRSERRWTRPMFLKVWTRYFGDFKRNGKYVYAQHYSNVRAMVPKENLLEYEVTQGWLPLCTFLGQPVPQRPFPHNNDRVEISARVTALVQYEAIKAVGHLLSVFAAFLVLVFLCSSL